MATDSNRVVAFLGPEGSYTHQAALSSFASQKSPVTLSPQTTITDIFTAVQSGTAYRGVVPFENSSNGSVVFTLDLFADLAGSCPDILVCGEAYVGVRHCLLGHATKGEAPDYSKITTLYSHPQAWGQCKSFLGQHLKHATRHDVSSTSYAAQLVSEDKSGTSAALSSIVAAELFHLDVLAEGINDRLGNTTRFLVIRRRDSPVDDDTTEQSTASTATERKDAAKSYKSLITFTISHTTPSALAHCLAVFGNHGLNLTSINTRPSGVRNWHYVFFVEFQGRKEEDGSGEVNKALGELDAVCRGWRWLGSWESALAEEERRGSGGL